MRIHYSMVFVSDMSASVAFFRDVIGMTLRFESPHWTEFATEGATLALHATDVPAPKMRIEELPAGSAKMGFEVEDLDAFHRRMLEHQVPVVQAPTVQFGAKLAQYEGPDHMVFSVGQART